MEFSSEQKFDVIDKNYKTIIHLKKWNKLVHVKTSRAKKPAFFDSLKTMFANGSPNWTLHLTTG